MLRTLIAANLLLVALGVGDLNFWIAKAIEGKNKVDCPLICTNVYGKGQWGSGWKSGGAKCTCGGAGNAEVTISCESSSPYKGCTGSQTGGSAEPPAPAPQQDPSLLSAFIVKCAKAADGRYAQKDGTVTDVKVKSDVGNAQCWDLAMGCIVNANKEGFNVNAGKSGHVSGMCNGWAWSHDVIGDPSKGYASVKAGDIAQFSSWNEGKKITHADGSWSSGSHSTGCVHTAVVVKNFDPTTGGLEMLDQNPSPVSKTVYHPRHSDGWYKSGKLMVYRVKSVVLDELPKPWLSRLYDMPEVATSFMAGPGLLVLVSGLFLVSALVMIVVRRSRRGAQEVPQELKHLASAELEEFSLEDPGLE